MARDEYDLAPDPTPVPKVRGSKAAPVAPVTPGAQRRGGTAPVVSYATPAAVGTAQAGVSAGAFVRGNRLVVKDGASLPDRCVKCNAPAGEGRVNKKLAYNLDNTRPAARLIPFVGRIILAIWAIQQMLTRQHVRVSYCVCKRHRTQRVLAMIAMGVGMLAGAALIVHGVNSVDRHGNPDAALIITGVVVFIAGSLCGMATGSLAVAAGFNNGAELKGAGKAFLESMPRPGVKTPFR
jgi:hypothetical protein